MSMKENLTLSAQRVVEERKKILEEQINRLQETNISGIQELKEQITPVTKSLRELLAQAKEEELKLATTLIQWKEVVRTSEEILKQQKRTGRQITLKIFLLAVLVGIATSLAIWAATLTIG